MLMCTPLVDGADFSFNALPPEHGDLRPYKHAVPISALDGRNLLLHDVPMFGNFFIADAEDIDRNHRLRSPSGVAAMNAYIIAVRHDQTGLVFEVRRQVSQKS